VIEIREYKLSAGGAAKWVGMANDNMELRQRNLPLRSFTMPESGGILNVGTHVYYYGEGYEERNAKRRAQQALPEWKAYLAEANACVVEQKSTLWVEAPLVKEFDLKSLAPSAWPDDTESIEAESDETIYELRRYQLKLGYETVPKFLELYRTGLPSKLEAGNIDPSTSLATVLYTEVGSLNEVVELWRHGGGTAAMNRSRKAGRGADQWRKAISSIADLAVSFQATIHRPLEKSPWQ